MKISVTLKDPDGFSESVEDAVKESLENCGLDDDERDAVFEKRQEKANKAIQKWVQYQEYVTIEFDIESMTATVKERT